MAHTVLSVDYDNPGVNKKVHARVDITSYPTGGELLSDLTGTMGSVKSVFAMGEEATMYLFAYDRTNNKLLVNTATGTEAADETDVGVLQLEITGV